MKHSSSEFVKDMVFIVSVITSVISVLYSVYGDLDTACILLLVSTGCYVTNAVFSALKL